MSAAMVLPRDDGQWPLAVPKGRPVLLSPFSLYLHSSDTIPSLFSVPVVAPRTGDRSLAHVSEGEESDEFWSFLGGKGPYPETVEGSVARCACVVCVSLIRHYRAVCTCYLLCVCTSRYIHPILLSSSLPSPTSYLPLSLPPSSPIVYPTCTHSLPMTPSPLPPAFSSWPLPPPPNSSCRR